MRAKISIEGDEGAQAIAEAEYRDHWISSGIQPSREAALEKLASMAMELWVDGLETKTDYEEGS